MKFIPPDDPTAVYPIGALKTEPPPTDSSTPAPARPQAPTAEAPRAEDAPRRSTATPRPWSSRTPPPAARNPLLLVGALAVGMLLAAGLLGALAFVLLLLQ